MEHKTKKKIKFLKGQSLCFKKNPCSSFSHFYVFTSTRTFLEVSMAILSKFSGVKSTTAVGAFLILPRNPVFPLT
jgi:hypothetical protein